MIYLSYLPISIYLSFNIFSIKILNCDCCTSVHHLIFPTKTKTTLTRTISMCISKIFHNSPTSMKVIFPLIRIRTVIAARRVPYFARTSSVESHLKCCHSSCYVEHLASTSSHYQNEKESGPGGKTARHFDNFFFVFGPIAIFGHFPE